MKFPALPNLSIPALPRFSGGTGSPETQASPSTGTIPVAAKASMSKPAPPRSARPGLMQRGSFASSSSSLSSASSRSGSPLSAALSTPATTPPTSPRGSDASFFTKLAASASQLSLGLLNDRLNDRPSDRPNEARNETPAKAPFDADREIRLQLTGEGKAPSTEHPGLTKQFVRDLKGAEFTIENRGQRAQVATDPTLAHAQLHDLTGGDAHQAFLVSAAAHQGLLAMPLNQIHQNAGLIPAGGSSGRPQFTLARLEDGSIQVKAHQAMAPTSVLDTVSGEMNELDPERSAGLLLASVRIGAAPHYEISTPEVAHNLNLEAG